ncbi:hypothetical protein SPHINGO8AM_190005 [Sphingomonas sp. 8AM]|nr:hypothetical protein SPHINGO8AM_190005 [Sphingomonas sp. 8AM]
MTRIILTSYPYDLSLPPRHQIRLGRGFPSYRRDHLLPAGTQPHRARLLPLETFRRRRFRHRSAALQQADPVTQPPCFLKVERASRRLHPRPQRADHARLWFTVVHSEPTGHRSRRSAQPISRRNTTRSLAP